MQKFKTKIGNNKVTTIADLKVGDCFVYANRKGEALQPGDDCPEASYGKFNTPEILVCQRIDAQGSGGFSTVTLNGTRPGHVQRSSGETPILIVDVELTAGPRE